MEIMGYSSVTKFWKDTHNNTNLATIAGYCGKKPLSIGLFYLFVDRLKKGNLIKSSCITQLHGIAKNKGTIRNLSSEKIDKKSLNKTILKESDSITDYLARELLASLDTPRPLDFQNRLESILTLSAVRHSAERGMLGDLCSLIVYGDGSTLPTQASRYGKPTCDCRKNGIFKCDHHDRIYFDATADFGFDSYKDISYFGHRYYQHCTAFNGHDLPLHVTIGPASETDYTLSLKSFDRMVKTFVECGFNPNISIVCYDAGHDAKGIYNYLLSLNHKPVIPLNPRSPNPKCTGTANCVNSEGVPLCKAGIPMKFHHTDRKRNRKYFHCPVKRTSHKDNNDIWISHLNECPLGVFCQPDTKCGPVVYVKTDTDPRLYPAISRESSEYKQIMKGRTCCERSNSQKKVAYKLGDRPCRSDTHFLFRLYLVSIIEHAKAWLDEDLKQYDGDIHKMIKALKTYKT